MSGFQTTFLWSIVNCLTTWLLVTFLVATLEVQWVQLRRLARDSYRPLSVFDIQTITEKELVEVLETILA